MKKATNENSTLILSCDIGTSGMKTCLYKVGDNIELINAATAWYPLHVMPDGGAEQDPLDWFKALKTSLKEVLKKTKLSAKEIKQIKGISFCSQMQGLVLVDNNCNPLRNAMSYMDQRARQEIEEGISRGIKIAGINLHVLFTSLKETGVVAASVKDPVWKYKWVEKNEPQNFSAIHKWLDVKDFLVSKLSGNFVMSEDSAFATLLYNSKKKSWSKPLCKLLKVNEKHLPKIIACTDKAGTLTADMAKELGLAKETIVFTGGGDASLIGVGAGATDLHDTHIYSGTSGWVGTVVNKRMIDINAMIASIVGAQPNLYNYFAELETAGKCLEWVKDHLAPDESSIPIKSKTTNKRLDKVEKTYVNLYDYMMQKISEAPAGSGGVLFTPWLHGNRCPFEDPNARGMFFNLSLETGKTEMIRSVVEGIAFHMRWFLESQEKKTKTSKAIRFVGGGALSENTCQIMADVLGREIETVADPQNVGAVGAAVVAAIGLGILSDFAQAKKIIQVEKVFYPNKNVKDAYEKNYTVYKKLYYANKKLFGILNS